MKVILNTPGTYVIQVQNESEPAKQNPHDEWVENELIFIRNDLQRRILDNTGRRFLKGDEEAIRHLQHFKEWIESLLENIKKHRREK